MGVPVLAGSGIKGLCRAVASYVGLDNHEMEKLFGPTALRRLESLGFRAIWCSLTRIPASGRGFAWT